MGTFTENPVLQKELRTQIRSRRQTPGVRNASIVVSGLITLLLYYYGARGILYSDGAAKDIFQAIGYIEMTLILFLAPSLTANAFTQEREQQTWNALLLSRLHADEIVIGKLIARMLPIALIYLLFLPLTVLASFVGGVPFATFLACQVLLIVAAVFFSTIGLFFSWANRRTSAATTVSFGTIAFLTAGTVMLWGLWSSATMGGSNRAEQFLPMWMNPFLAVYVACGALNYGSRDESSAPYVFFLVFCLVMTAVMVRLMIKRLSRGPKEMEQ